MAKFGRYYLYLFIALFYIAAVVLTDGRYWGDTSDYVDSVLAYAEGRNYRFWDFGHLFWRPLGWFVWNTFFDTTDQGSMRTSATFAFQMIAYISGLVSALLVTRILLSFGLGSLVTAFAASAFVLAHAFLNFAQTGKAYIPGLMCYLIGLLFVLEAKNGPSKVKPILAGIFLAFSFCFWIAYLWTIPAAMLASVVLFGFDRAKVVGLVVTGVSFGVTLLVFFGSTLWLLEIRTFQGLIDWITIAAHGDQTSGVARVVFGTARSFVYLGREGVIFKRYLLDDPLNPVSISELIRGSLALVTVFYSLAAIIVVQMLRLRETRRFAGLLAIAVVPVIIFATQHGGGDIDWHLAHFPYSFAALGLAIHYSTSNLLKSLMIGMVVVLGIVNLYEMSIWRSSEILRDNHARIDPLEGSLREGDQIFLVNWADSLNDYRRTFPYDSFNSEQELRFNVLVTPGTGQTREWREEFGARCLRAWDAGANVWLSNRAFSQLPKPEWSWSEGDDKNVKWHEFPAFVHRLEIGQRLGDENGFSLILPTEQNREYLRPFAEAFSHKEF